MPTMWTPDGRAVPIPQTGVAAALRNGLSMVPVRGAATGFPDKPTLMSSEGVTFLDSPLSTIERITDFVRRYTSYPIPGGRRVPADVSGPAMWLFSSATFIDRLMGRGSEEFIAKESDIPVPDFDAVTGVRASTVDPDILEMYQKFARGMKAPPSPGLEFTGIERPDMWARFSGDLTLTQILELRIACNAGDKTACDILDELDVGDGGGGGGAARPKYVPPDERLVQDQVEAMLTALVGSAGSSQQYVDIYMKDDKRRWEGAAVDPGQSVLEAIRATTSYKTIHKNRPDFIKEGDWIGRQIVNLERQGLRASDIQQRAIDLATAGSTPTAKDASVAQVQATGQFTPEFMRRIGDAAATIARTI